MSETISFTTCKDRRQAARIARALVKEKLAACVNIVPGLSMIRYIAAQKMLVLGPPVVFTRSNINKYSF